jgi:PncC family amidohydrolase
MLLRSLVKQVSLLLKQNQLTLSVIESCTGGMLASLFTSRAGASQFFIGGVVVYSNQLKEDLLKVSQSLLAEYGAVSNEVVESLVINGQKITKSDITIAISGIAGPKSDDSNKKLGLVYIGVAYGEQIVIKQYNFNSWYLFFNKRNIIQRRACKAVLLLIQQIL